MEITEIRKQLDEIDKELLNIIAKRMSLIPKIAEYKKEHNVQRHQPEREKEIIETKRKVAEELGLNPDLVEDIFKRLIEDAHRIEKEIIGK